MMYCTRAIFFNEFFYSPACCISLLLKVSSCFPQSNKIIYTFCMPDICTAVVAKKLAISVNCEPNSVAKHMARVKDEQTAICDVKLSGPP